MVITGLLRRSSRASRRSRPSNRVDGTLPDISDLVRSTSVRSFIFSLFPFSLSVSIQYRWDISPLFRSHGAHRRAPLQKLLRLTLMRLKIGSFRLFHTEFPSLLSCSPREPTSARFSGVFLFSAEVTEDERRLGSRRRPSPVRWLVCLRESGVWHTRLRRVEQVVVSIPTAAST